MYTNTTWKLRVRDRSGLLLLRCFGVDFHVAIVKMRIGKTTYSLSVR